MKNKTLILLFYVLMSGFLYAQEIPIGSWRTHFSYQKVHALAETESVVYATSENGFFYLDKQDNSLYTLGKEDGFSGGLVKHLAYAQAHKTLIIVYASGNIDFVQKNKIYNLPTLKNKKIFASKKVNHLFLHNDLAYLSTDFGVLVLDIQKRNIRETYQDLGTTGESLRVNAACILGEEMFLATAIGVLKANLMSNLSDFSSWTLFGASSGILAQEVKAITSFEGKVYAGIENQNLYAYDGTSNWTSLSIPLGKINQLKALDKHLALCLDNRLQLLDKDRNITTLSDDLITNPQDITESNGKQWIADQNNGLLLYTQGRAKAFYPTGTFSANAWKLSVFQEKLLSVTGGYTDNATPLNREEGFSIFDKNGTWTNYNASGFQGSQVTPKVLDIIDGVYDAQTKSLYLASFQQGILQQKEGLSYTIIDQNTSGSLLTLNAKGKLQIGGLASDNKGKLWIASYEVANGEPSLFSLDASGKWESFVFGIAPARFPLDILRARSGFLWVRLAPNRGGGIWVLDPETKRNIHINTNSGTGDLPSNAVYAIAEDKKGALWIGTDDGVVVIRRPSAVFKGEISAGIPVYENRPLLASTTAYSIAIDGGNRKWIGTDKGLWLFDENGTRLIHHFTTDNSPLVSNNILDVAIKDSTGEVFIATDKGILSYRGRASRGESVYQTVKVFPNPVRADFNGWVGISGLVDNAQVKITDISGKLIYETNAQGGTATWNVNDYNGQRAKTGIYLIFSTNSDGTQSLVNKIAVIE